jgi:MFS family permease
LKKEWLVFLFVFLFFLGSRISFFYIPIYLNELNFSGLEIGLLIGLSAVAAFIGFFPSGLINDRNSFKKPLIFSLILLALFYFGLSVFSGFELFFVLFLLGGLGLNVGRNTLKNYFMKISISGKEGYTMGLFELISILGIFFGVLTASFLVPVYSFQIFLKAISVLFILLIVFVFFLKPIKMTETKLSGYKSDFLKKNVLFFALILFLFTLHWGAESTAYGLLLTEYFELNLFFAGIYMAFPLLFLGLSAFYFGKKIDAKKIDFSLVFLIGMLLSGLTHILMTFPLIEFSFLMRVIHEFGDGLAQIGLVFWIFKSFNFERLAGNASLIMTVTVLGEIIGAILFSTLGGNIGYQYAFIGSGITSILAAVLFFIYLKKYKNN